MKQACQNCPSGQNENWCAFLFLGYGIIVLLPFIDLGPIYQTLNTDPVSRGVLGAILLSCASGLKFSLWKNNCRRRAKFIYISTCVWGYIAASYIYFHMPFLFVWSATVAIMCLSRSFININQHLLQSHNSIVIPHNNGYPIICHGI